MNEFNCSLAEIVLNRKMRVKSSIFGGILFFYKKLELPVFF